MKCIIIRVNKKRKRFWLVASQTYIYSYEIVLIFFSPNLFLSFLKAARTLPDEEEAGEVFVDAQECLTSRAVSQPVQSTIPRVRPNSIATATPATAAVGSKFPPATRNGSSDNWQTVIPQVSFL